MRAWASDNTPTCTIKNRSRSRDVPVRRRNIADRSRSRDVPIPRSSREAPIVRSAISERSRSLDPQTWSRWEPYGSNRGGKGAPRGSPPSWGGPDGSTSWRHDLFEEASSQDLQFEEEQYVGLAPRGMGSGRSAGGRSSGGGVSVAVRNLDPTATVTDLGQLFAKIGALADVRLDGSGIGYVEFFHSADAAQAVRRYHRHPWKGGRPLNVVVQRGQNARRW